MDVIIFFPSETRLSTNDSGISIIYYMWLQSSCQRSDVVASLHESEALVTAVIVQEVISDRVVKLNPTTMDSRTDQAAVDMINDLNVSKWKLYSP